MNLTFKRRPEPLCPPVQVAKRIMNDRRYELVSPEARVSIFGEYIKQLQEKKQHEKDSLRRCVLVFVRLQGSVMLGKLQAFECMCPHSGGTFLSVSCFEISVFFSLLFIVSMVPDSFATMWVYAFTDHPFCHQQTTSKGARGQRAFARDREGARTSLPGTRARECSTRLQVLVTGKSSDHQGVRK